MLGPTVWELFKVNNWNEWKDQKQSTWYQWQTTQPHASTITRGFETPEFEVVNAKATYHIPKRQRHMCGGSSKFNLLCHGQFGAVWWPVLPVTRTHRKHNQWQTNKQTQAERVVLFVIAACSLCVGGHWRYLSSAHCPVCQVVLRSRHPVRFDHANRTMLSFFNWWRHYWTVRANLLFSFQHCLSHQQLCKIGGSLVPLMHRQHTMDTTKTRKQHSAFLPTSTSDKRKQAQGIFLLCVRYHPTSATTPWQTLRFDQRRQTKTNTNRTMPQYRGWRLLSFFNCCSGKFTALAVPRANLLFSVQHCLSHQQLRKIGGSLVPLMHWQHTMDTTQTNPCVWQTNVNLAALERRWKEALKKGGDLPLMSNDRPKLKRFLEGSNSQPLYEAGFQFRSRMLWAPKLWKIEVPLYLWCTHTTHWRQITNKRLRGETSTGRIKTVCQHQTVKFVCQDQDLVLKDLTNIVEEKNNSDRKGEGGGGVCACNQFPKRRESTPQHTKISMTMDMESWMSFEFRFNICQQQNCDKQKVLL